MPPMVLNDSEGEDEDILCHDDRSSRNSEASIPPLANLDGACDVQLGDQSTGSTGTATTNSAIYHARVLTGLERLRKAIHVAEDALAVGSADQPTSRSSAASPSVQRLKRRHSESHPDQPIDGVDPQTLKRTKTADSRVPSEATLASMTNSSGSALAPSAMDSIAAFQATSFMQQDPNVLFRESGSTVPDDASAQQRMLEQALQDQVPDTVEPGVYLKIGPSETSRSSSFPWTASVEAPDQQLSYSQAGAAHHQSGSDTRASWHEELTGPMTLDLPNTSPIVEIRVPNTHASSLPRNTSDSMQKSTKGRKRKSYEGPDDRLSSESGLVGLPVERYEARPSRRRATNMEGRVPANYSINPDKAAKVKRNKTSDARFQPSASLAKPTLVDVVAEAQQKPIASDESKVTEEAAGNAEQNDGCVGQVEQEEEAPVETAGECRADGETQPSTLSSAKGAVSPSMATTGKKTDQEVFSKPTVPSNKTKRSTKSRRSHTTIFEDHVDMTEVPQSQTLSQQQAKRKAALREIENSSPSVQTKRGSKLTAASIEDEDELASDPAAAHVSADSNHRSKGQSAKKSQKSEGNAMLVEDTDVPAPPKKRGRGRPPKNAAPVDVATNDRATPVPVEPVIDPIPEQRAQDEREATPPPTEPKQVDTPNLTPPSSPRDAATAQHAPTNSSQHVEPNESASKTSPITHSPIKSSSIVPLRVGLSRRMRIPPLLKIVKPQKK